MNHKEHQKRVRELGCCVCETDQQMTFHHCKGGSITEYFGYDLSPGTGQKQNEFLGIPLCWHHHVFDMGIDSGMGVIEWERVYGGQIGYLIWTNDQLDYDIFDLAGVPNPSLRPIKSRG